MTAKQAYNTLRDLTDRYWQKKQKIKLGLPCYENPPPPPTYTPQWYRMRNISTENISFENVKLTQEQYLSLVRKADLYDQWRGKQGIIQFKQVPSHIIDGNVVDWSRHEEVHHIKDGDLPFEIRRKITEGIVKHEEIRIEVSNDLKKIQSVINNIKRLPRFIKWLYGIDLQKRLQP